jgi:DNA-binding NtrC family response regulator
MLKRSTNAFVIEASSPYGALSIARSIGRPIDLLVSDIDLHAAKTGLELAREIAANNPSAAVLLMSGGDSPVGAIPAEWRFLAKPFPLEVLLDCVSELCRCVRPA